MSLRKALTRFGGAMLATMILAAAGTAGAAAAPPYTLEERALAISAPALLFLETDYTGYVRDKATHQALYANPITYRRICSAFVVNSAGYAVTTSVCAKPTPSAILRNVLDRLGATLADQKKITAEQRKTYTDDHEKLVELTGADPGTEPTMKMTAQVNFADSGKAAEPATQMEIPAEVLTAMPPSSGGVTVIKIAKTGLPAAELAADRTVTQGTSVVIAGFASTDAAFQTFTVQTKQVQITAVSKSDRADWYRLSEDLGAVSHGGLVIDTSGKVVGMIDSDVIGDDRANRGVSSVRNIAAALKDVSVDNALSGTDKLYRSGLDAYFNGRYEQAVKELGQVIQQSPDNQMAVAYKQRATDRQAVETGDGGLPVWVIALISAFGGAIIVGGILVFALRRRRGNDFDADLLVPVSLNPFAPVSGMPTSGSGTGYPPGAFEPATQAGTVMPTPAPTGIPIPYPPVQLPHIGDEAAETDRTAADAAGASDRAAAAEVSAPLTESFAPAVAPPPPPPAQVPEFTWPDDDEVRSEPLDPAQHNPWARRHPTDD